MDKIQRESPCPSCHGTLYSEDDKYEDDMVRDAERYRWLRDHVCSSLHLSHNGDHSCNYTTAKEWIEEYAPSWFNEDDPQEIEQMKQLDTIWTLQVYPDTPVGFVVWNGASLDSVIDRAIEEKGGVM